MSRLRFFSRVAFLCNICFLLALFILWLDQPPEGDMVSLVIVIGFVLAVIVNFIVNFAYGIQLIRRKQLTPVIPRWLIIANFIFLIPQIILLMK